MRHAPSILQAASGLWTPSSREEGTRKSKSFAEQDLRFWFSSEPGTQPEALQPLRCDEYRKQSIELSTAMVFVQRACGVKEDGSIAYSTVVCSANVIAVSYQHTGSFRSDPVDTGRALAKTLCQTRVQHRATVNATCQNSEPDWHHAAHSLRRQLTFSHLRMKV